MSECDNVYIPQPPPPPPITSIHNSPSPSSPNPESERSQDSPQREKVSVELVYGPRETTMLQSNGKPTTEQVKLVSQSKNGKGGGGIEPRLFTPPRLFWGLQISVLNTVAHSLILIIRLQLLRL